jgi:signal transduction histidine kinase
MIAPRVRRGSPAWVRWPRHTARLRFTAVYGGLFLLSGAALVATTYVLFERATEYRAPQLPQVPHTPTIHGLQLGLAQGPSAFAQALPRLAKAQLKLAQDQYQLSQKLRPRAGGVAPSSLSLPRVLADQRQLTQDQHQLAAVQDQLAAAVHQIAQSGAAQAAQRTADSHQLLLDSGIALGVVAVLALLAGWLVAGRMLRPIRTITRTARRISSASLHERLALDGPQDELKELGDTLDELFDRLEESFEAQRQFAANASHELRTPLARQRALIQVALADPQASFSSLRAAHERVLVSEQHLEQMIDALLTLTRGQAGLERQEQLDLAVIASQILLSRAAEIAGRDLDLREALAEAPIAGDPRLIDHLLANVIDNAIRHNKPGGHIEIVTGTRGPDAFVSIGNTGPTVPPEEIRRLFQPFQRLGGPRTRHNGGHGLGLSIVQAIATAHGAELRTRARAQGGLSIEVSFPPASGAGSTTTRAASLAVSGQSATARPPAGLRDCPSGETRRSS